MARKIGLSEAETSQLLQRYNAGTLLSLLREVGKVDTAKVDWQTIWQKVLPTGGSAREVQALWRHIAYSTELADSYSAGEEPLEDESDLDDELDPPTGTSREAQADAAACVKADMERHGLIESATPSSRKRKADGTTAGAARPSSAKQKAANGQARGGQKLHQPNGQLGGSPSGTPVLSLRVTLDAAQAGIQVDGKLAADGMHLGLGNPSSTSGVDHSGQGKGNAWPQMSQCVQGQVSGAGVPVGLSVTTVEGVDGVGNENLAGELPGHGHAQGGDLAVGKPVGCFPGNGVSSGSAGGNGALDCFQGEQGRRRRKLWTGEEDEALIAAVDKYGEGNWVKILLTGDYAFQRTAAQLSQRWAAIKKRKERVMYSNGVGMLAASGPLVSVSASVTSTTSARADNSAQQDAGIAQHVMAGGGSGAGSGVAVTDGTRQPSAQGVAGMLGQGGQASGGYTWGMPAVTGTAYGISSASAPMYAAGVGPTSGAANGAAANAGGGTSMVGPMGNAQVAMGGGKSRNSTALRLGDNARPGSPLPASSGSSHQMRGPHATPPRTSGVGGVGVSRRLIAPGAVVMSAAAAQAASVGGSEMWQATSLPASSCSSLQQVSASSSSTQPNPLVQAAAVAAGARIASTSGGAISPVVLNVKPDPMVQAAALAAGARIAPASAAAELLKTSQSCTPSSRPFVVSRPLGASTSGPGTTRNSISLAGRANMARAASTSNGTGLAATRLAMPTSADGTQQAVVGNPKVRQNNTAAVPASLPPPIAAAPALAVKAAGTPMECASPSGAPSEQGIPSLPAPTSPPPAPQEVRPGDQNALPQTDCGGDETTCLPVEHPAGATAIPAIIMSPTPSSSLVSEPSAAAQHGISALAATQDTNEAPVSVSAGLIVSSCEPRMSSAPDPPPTHSSSSSYTWAMTGLSGVATWEVQVQGQLSVVEEAGGGSLPGGGSAELSAGHKTSGGKHSSPGEAQGHRLSEAEIVTGSGSHGEAEAGNEENVDDDVDELVFTTGPAKPAFLEFTTTCLPTPAVFSFAAEPVMATTSTDDGLLTDAVHTQQVMPGSVESPSIVLSGCYLEKAKDNIGTGSARPALVEVLQTAEEGAAVVDRAQVNGGDAGAGTLARSVSSSRVCVEAAEAISEVLVEPSVVVKEDVDGLRTGCDPEEDSCAVAMDVEEEEAVQDARRAAEEETGLLSRGSPQEEADDGQPARKRGRPPKRARAWEKSS